MAEKKEIKVDVNMDADLEAFTNDLGCAIFDLNKKHSNILYRTNLGNVLTQFFRFMKFLKEEKERGKENDEKN